VVVLVQLAQAVAEAKASSILTTGSVQLGHVGSYLRSRHGYLVAIRHANAVKRPRAYLRMLYHSYLVIRGLEGLEGELRHAGVRRVGLLLTCEGAGYVAAMSSRLNMQMCQNPLFSAVQLFV
jgi:hypothetical protein